MFHFYSLLQKSYENLAVNVFHFLKQIVLSPLTTFYFNPCSSVFSFLTSLWFHGFNIVHVFTLPKLMSSYVYIYSIYSVLIVDSWVSVRCTSLNISTKCLIPASCPTPQNLLCSTPSSLESTNQHPSRFSVQRPSGHFILSFHIPWSADSLLREQMPGLTAQR